MKYCDDCAVNIDVPLHSCPLCNAFLRQKNDTTEPIQYPNLQPQAEAYDLVFRILLFLSLTVAVVCVTINILTFDKLYWSLIVIACIFYAWIAISSASRGKKNIYFTILVQLISLSALLVALSLFMRVDGIVFTYILPALFVSATLCITIIVIVKGMQVQEFILYFILTAFLGFIPLLLVLFNLTLVKWPAIVSALYSGLSLVSLFVFADNSTKLELRKRLNL